MDTLLIALLGLFLGALVNLLADDLPVGRRLRLLSRQEIWRRIRHARRYPLVEVATSFGMALAYALARDRHGLAGLEALIQPAFVPLLVLVAVIDIQSRQILLRPLLACALIAILRALATPQHAPSAASMLAGAVAAALAFSLLYLGGRLFARLAKGQGAGRESLIAFGLGDVYLMTLGGFILGFPAALIAMTLTIFFGGLGALGYLVAKTLSGGYERFSAIPYAPGIVASIYIVTLLPREMLRGLFSL